MHRGGWVVWGGHMGHELRTPRVDELGDVIGALRSWQVDGAPLQLHPGDVGWFWRRGPEATAASLRTWTCDGWVAAVGLLDGPDLLRVGFAPNALRDAGLAAQVVADVVAQDDRVLAAGAAYVETPPGALVHDLLGEAGWDVDDPWVLMCRQLARPVQDPGLRIVVVDPGDVDDWCRVHHAAFGGAADLTLDDLRARWLTMSCGLPFAEARCLLGLDSAGSPVAAVTVWSAGPGRPGVIEPMGVDPRHRGAGHGRAISLAAAAALRELGASAALVCTQASNTGAVATCVSAGLQQVGVRHDRRRPPG